MTTIPPLRILHTADWHLGARFHKQDRSVDEDAALARICALCQEHAVDVVIVAGDVFDTPNPAAEDQRRYYRCLQRLVTEAGVGTVLVTAGNHDSGARMDAPREFLAAYKVEVRGALAREADPAACMVDLCRRDGTVAAIAAAVPYLREADLDVAAGQERLPMRQARAMEARFAQIRQAAQERAAQVGLPLVVVAHCFASSGKLGGGERPVVSEEVGNLGQVNLATLAEGAAYAALGHLHRPQAVAGQEHWRYSGSLLPTGFDDAGTVRSVTLVEVPAQGPATAVHLPLDGVRLYADLAGDLEAVRREVLALPLCGEDDVRGFLRARIDLDAPRSGVSAEVEGWAEDQGWRALIVERGQSQMEVSETGGRAALVPVIELQPAEVFQHAYAAAYPETQPSEALRDAFQELHRSVIEEGI